MTEETTSPVEVTQAHRDAAADLWRWLLDLPERDEVATPEIIARTEDEYRAGKWDEEYTVQAFARCAHEAVIASRATDNALSAELRRVALTNGPVVIDNYGEGLAWRPLDYGTWTPLAALEGEG